LTDAWKRERYGHSGRGESEVEGVPGEEEEKEEKEDEEIVGAAATVVEVLVEGEEERKVWEMQNPYETYLSKLDG
jgi:hypothetical protein